MTGDVTATSSLESKKHVCSIKNTESKVEVYTCIKQSASAHSTLTRTYQSIYEPVIRYNILPPLRRSLRSRPQRPQSLRQIHILLADLALVGGVEIRQGALAKLVLELDVGLIGHFLHEEVDLVLRRRDSRGGLHRVLHVRGLHVQVGELGFEFVHHCGYLLGGERRESRYGTGIKGQVWNRSGVEHDGFGRRTRSRFIDSIALSIPRTTEVIFPVTCPRTVSAQRTQKMRETYGSHRHCRLNPARHGINSGREPQQVESLVLLPDRIRGIYPCTVRVALLERLLGPPLQNPADEDDQ